MVGRAEREQGGPIQKIYFIGVHNYMDGYSTVSRHYILKLSVHDNVICVHVPVVVHVSLLVCVEQKIKTSC